MGLLKVLLHTYMDSLRGAGHGDEEGEGEGREINHHGKIITVGGGGGSQKDLDDSVSIAYRRDSLFRCNFNPNLNVNAMLSTVTAAVFVHI